MDRVKILEPDDDPPPDRRLPPQLERLAPYGEVTVHETRPADKAEQVEMRSSPRRAVPVSDDTRFPYEFGRISGKDYVHSY